MNFENSLSHSYFFTKSRQTVYSVIQKFKYHNNYYTSR